MSRYYDDGDGPDYNNAYELWEWNLVQALGSPRGQQALRDFREALLALPEKRLIARALCTVGDDRSAGGTEWSVRAFDELVEEQGRGVCAVGAYAWHKRVKSGEDPAAAFAALPTLDDMNHGSWETANLGAEYGLAKTLADHLAYQNDESWSHCTPEERWQKFMDWIEAQLTVVTV